jgi:hypothetical protein
MWVVVGVVVVVDKCLEIFVPQITKCHVPRHLKDLSYEFTFHHNILAFFEIVKGVGVGEDESKMKEYEKAFTD